MEVIDYKDRTAQKEHKCFFCSGTIEKGEVYEWQKNKYNGEIYELKAHKRCLDLAEHYDMYRDCDDEGLTGDYFYELIREIFDDEFSTAEKVQLLYNHVFGEE